MFEGDMKLTPEQKEAMEDENDPEKRGGGVARAVQRWRNNEVPFVIDSSRE